MELINIVANPMKLLKYITISFAQTIVTFSRTGHYCSNEI
jgi:hypothetical protein